MKKIKSGLPVFYETAHAEFASKKFFFPRDKEQPVRFNKSNKAISIFFCWLKISLLINATVILIKIKSKKSQ